MAYPLASRVYFPWSYFWWEFEGLVLQMLYFIWFGFLFWCCCIFWCQANSLHSRVLFSRKNVLSMVSVSHNPHPQQINMIHCLLWNLFKLYSNCQLLKPHFCKLPNNLGCYLFTSTKEEAGMQIPSTPPCSDKSEQLDLNSHLLMSLIIYPGSFPWKAGVLKCTLGHQISHSAFSKASEKEQGSLFLTQSKESSALNKKTTSLQSCVLSMLLPYAF